MSKKKKIPEGPVAAPPEQHTPKPASGRWAWVEGLDDPENAVVVRIGLGLALLAIALRFLFWAYTGRNWEDALITVQHSENLMRGMGLTHYLGPGEAPLHGFTSPLSVLVPLIGDLFKVGFGLSFIKIVSALAGACTVLFAMAFGIHPRVKLPAPLTVLAMAYLAVEHHQVLWGMAGMETQITTLILLMSLYFAVAEKPGALGVSLGFCMLARPDFAFWTVIAGLYALLRYPRRLPVVVGMALAVYLPWILFTTWYYGSPVPNTMVAKGLGYPLWTTWPGFDRTPAYVLGQMLQRLTGSYEPGAVFQPLGPSFAGHGNGYRAVFNDHGMICNFMIAMAVAGAVDALRRRQWVWLPVILFTLVYAVYYVFCVALVFSWYLTPFAAVTLLLSARGVHATVMLLRAPRARFASLSVFAAAYIACFLIVLPQTFATEKAVQERVENQVRKQAGLFLGRVMEKNETVGTEPLGYLSYYSRRIVHDWPGLCSRKVVAYSKTHAPGERSLLQMLEALRPDFLTLRYFEYSGLEQAPWIDDNYRIIASFELPYDRNDPLFKMNMDMGFLVLAKKTWRPGSTEFNGEPLGINPAHARALNCAADRLMRQNKLSEAVDLLNRSVKASPDLAEARSNLGLALNRMGNAAGAVEQFRKAVELDPNDALAHNNLGVSLLDTGNSTEAEAALKEAIRCDATYVEPILNLADAVARRGDLAEGRRYFESVLKIEPGNSAAADGIRKIDAAMNR